MKTPKVTTETKIVEPDTVLADLLARLEKVEKTIVELRERVFGQASE
jgi:hypothetical protein